jgi:hypothetical protein
MDCWLNVLVSNARPVKLTVAAAELFFVSLILSIRNLRWKSLSNPEATFVTSTQSIIANR